MSLLLTFSSCKKDQVANNIDANCVDTVSFSTTVLDLIQTNCTGCHDVGNSTGYTFTNHTNISNNAAAILNSMRGQAGFKQMPDGLPSLPDSVIQKFNCWVNQGKLNN
jgi:hypothetical protein